MSKNGARTRKIDYTSAEGLPQRSLIPADANGIDPQEGIPLHLDLDPLYGHLPLEFRQRLYTALHARGLIEPADFLKPGAAELYMAAMRQIIKEDALSAIRLAKEVIHHG